jgi:hypothetical protein
MPVLRPRCWRLASRRARSRWHRSPYPLYDRGDWGSARSRSAGNRKAAIERTRSKAKEQGRTNIVKLVDCRRMVHGSKSGRANKDQPLASPPLSPSRGKRHDNKSGRRRTDTVPVSSTVDEICRLAGRSCVVAEGESIRHDLKRQENEGKECKKGQGRSETRRSVRGPSVELRQDSRRARRRSARFPGCRPSSLSSLSWMPERGWDCSRASTEQGKRNTDLIDAPRPPFRGRQGLNARQKGE